MILLIGIMETNALNNDCPGKFEMCGSDWPNLAKEENLVCPTSIEMKSQIPLVVSSTCNAGDIRDMGSTPGSGRYPGGGHEKSPQYSCLENPMDRGAWWATVHGVAKCQT